MEQQPTASDSVAVLAVYGTLREGVATVGGAVVPEVRTLVRGVRVPGWLYDTGAYPAAVVDWAAVQGDCAVSSTIECDLVEVGVDRPVAWAWAGFDAYERVVDCDAGPARYRRVLVPLEATHAGEGGAGRWADGIPAGAVTDAADGAGRWADGIPARVWIYEWVLPVADLTPVPGGVWRPRP